MASGEQSTADDAKMKRLLAIMDDTGWGGYVIRRRCHDYARVEALASIGVVSSADAPSAGQEDWKLNLTRLGTKLRRELIRIEEMEDA